MKIILLIIFWAVSVTIPVMIITLAALGESIRCTGEQKGETHHE